MSDDKQLEDAMRDLILEVCEVLHARGYDEVPVGAMMRLIGVSEERARDHDQEFFALDEEFARQVKKKNSSKKRNRKPIAHAPAGVTLH
jgi:hypothetical protein